MAGKPNKKWLASMIAKHGSQEAVSSYMKEIAAKGGRNGHDKGFKLDRALASRVGAIGGRVSRRTGVKNKS